MKTHPNNWTQLGEKKFGIKKRYIPLLRRGIFECPGDGCWESEKELDRGGIQQRLHEDIAFPCFIAHPDK